MRLICQECEREFTLNEVPEVYPCGHAFPKRTTKQLVDDARKMLEELLTLYGSLGYSENEALLMILDR
jgi:hypothetical protein